MKRIILLTIVAITLSGCGEIKNRKLYNLTDNFVENVNVNYYSNRNFLHASEEKYEGKYRVMQIGKLINVKISEYATSEEYEELRDELKKHYKNHSKVKDVFICNGGTIMIDCRSRF